LPCRALTPRLILSVLSAGCTLVRHVRSVRLLSHVLLFLTLMVIFPGKAEVESVQYDLKTPSPKTYPIRRTHPSPSRAPPPRAPPRRRTTRRPYSPPVQDAALQQRRHVYRYNLYSFHVGSNPFSGYRDVTPHMVATTPALQSRARAWIRRELRVFTFLHTLPSGSSAGGPTTSSNAEFLLAYIVSILKMVDLKASNGHAENLLTEFLGRQNARLFLHELGAWLRSPYAKLEEWDEEVQYGDIDCC
jgi:hypothetical protein